MPTFYVEWVIFFGKDIWGGGGGWGHKAGFSS